MEFGEISVEELVAVRIRARDHDQQADLQLSRGRDDPCAGIGGAQIGLDGADVGAVPAALIGCPLQ